MTRRFTGARPFIHISRGPVSIDAHGDTSCSLGVVPAQPEVAGGMYARWNWSGERLEVRTDRYGFFPLFYAADSSGICVSTSIERILERGFAPILDESALAVFLRLGWFVGEDTPFRNVRALPPGATLRWSDGRLEVKTGGLLIANRQDISKVEAMDRYAELFQAAIRRCAPSPDRSVIALSGGRDSRHIVLALHAAGLSPAASVTQRYYTFADPGTDPEVTTAKQLARELSIQHTTLDQSASRLTAELRKNALTSYCALEHGWAVPIGDHVTGRWDYLYDGIGGDVLSAGLFLEEDLLSMFERGDRHRLAEEILGREGYLPHFLSSPNYRRFSRERAIERLMLELCLHANAPNPVGSFFFWNRTRRTIANASCNIFGRQATVIAPYLDVDVFDFLSSLPAALFLDHQFHTDTLHRAYPRFAHVPFAIKNAPVVDFAQSRRFGAELIGYIASGPSLVRRLPVAVRAMRCLVDKKYSPAIWSFGHLATYLRQLGAVTAHARSDQHETAGADGSPSTKQHFGTRIRAALGSIGGLSNVPARYRSAFDGEWRGPSHADPSPDDAITAAAQWLGRAQDQSATRDGGVARHFSLRTGWAASYPETTGYIIPTFLEMARRNPTADYDDRASRMLHWLTTIQLPSGAFAGGMILQQPVVPVTFNTGQIVLGLAAGAAAFGEPYAAALRRAADWLVETQDGDGCWRRFPTPFAVAGEKSYETHVAWGLMEADRVDRGRGYGDAALRNVWWALGHQTANGWVRNCCLTDPTRPLTHTLGYFLRGVLEAHRFTRERSLLAAAARTADGLITTQRSDGALPGRLTSSWRAAVSSTCLTGNVQIAHSWLILFQETGDVRYFEAAQSAIRYVRRTIPMTAESDIRGAVRGSFPIWGDYAPHQFINWAAKFFIDAQLLEQDLLSGGEAQRVLPATARATVP